MAAFDLAQLCHIGKGYKKRHTNFSHDFVKAQTTFVPMSDCKLAFLVIYYDCQRVIQPSGENYYVDHIWL